MKKEGCLNIGKRGKLECLEMFGDVYRGAGRYEWSEGNTVLTLSNEFGEITLERGLIDDEEVLINTDRPEHRVAKEGWILIRSQHATLKSPLVP